MHFLMFRLKRAHLRSLAIARRLYEELGLTPARYDLLYALGWTALGQEHQYTLWRALGISRTSGSKMVRRLMELGLVTRWRSKTDRRTYVVAFTETGAVAMRRAMLFLVTSRVLRRAYELVFGNPPIGETPETAVAVQNLAWAVDRVARRFGDTSRNLYPSREDPEDNGCDYDLDGDDDPDSPDGVIAFDAQLQAPAAGTHCRLVPSNAHS